MMCMSDVSVNIQQKYTRADCCDVSRYLRLYQTIEYDFITLPSGAAAAFPLAKSNAVQIIAPNLMVIVTQDVFPST